MSSLSDGYIVRASSLEVRNLKVLKCSLRGQELKEGMLLPLDENDGDVSAI